MTNCGIVGVDGRISCHLPIFDVLNITGVAPLMELFEFSLKCAFWVSLCYSWALRRNQGIFQVPAASYNFEVAFPVTFFGGA